METDCSHTLLATDTMSKSVKSVQQEIRTFYKILLHKKQDKTECFNKVCEVHVATIGIIRKWESWSVIYVEFIWVFKVAFLVSILLQWGSEIRPFEILTHLKSELFEGQIPNGPVFK